MGFVGQRVVWFGYVLGNVLLLGNDNWLVVLYEDDEITYEVELPISFMTINYLMLCCAVSVLVMWV